MRLSVAAVTLSLGLITTAGFAGAQTLDTVGPHSLYCGSWQNGVFVPNGNCVEETTTTTTTVSTGQQPAVPSRQMSRVRGTITSVKGHLVTLQQSTQNLVVDDSRALRRQDTGRVAVGRSVVAHGYWDDGTFFATSFE